MKKGIITITIMLFTALGIAQEGHHIREADVMWSTRIWREIDLRQKINQPLYYPLEPSQGYMSLFDALVQEVREGYITAYSTGPLGTDDEFRTPLSKSEFEALIVEQEVVQTTDPDTEQVYDVEQDVPILSSDILRYRIKEDWVFDKQRSTMVPRIIGIAPMLAVYGEDGELRGMKVLFWVPFKEAQYGLQFYPVYLRHNNNKDLSYGDLFAKRFFDSYIVKESNVADRMINSYANGVDALIEGQEIEESIRTFESDLWHH